ncbi:MAG: glycerol dehydrogenase [Enterococcus avium]
MRAWGSPDKYIQGSNILSDIGVYVAHFGEKFTIVMDPIFIEDYQSVIQESILKKNSASNIQFIEFDQQITRKNIDHLYNKVSSFSPEVIISIGGGKIIDAVKVLSNRLTIPMIICPTVASTDAPTSGMSIIYDDSGAVIEIALFDKNPNLVLVDTLLISKAPVRFFISGIGDALSTYFEAIANKKLCHSNYILNTYGAFESTLSAHAIAKECYSILCKNSRLAVKSINENILNQYVEDIIEANILMSGLGFENCGCSIAHGIGNAIAALPGGVKALHGERVAFGTLCQLVAADYSNEQIMEFLELCTSIELPVSLTDLGIEKNELNIRKIAEISLEAESMQVNPQKLTITDVISIIKTANLLGKEAKSKFEKV